MPKKPKRPCSYPNCPKLTEGRFCEKHLKEENKRYEKYGRNYKIHKRYGSTWRKIREKYVRAHPFCELCFNEGIMQEVEHVHHKVPLADGGTHDVSNLMSLCHSCHSKLHSKKGERRNKKATRK